MTSPSRRRQRSTRLVVAVGLLLLSAVLVGWAVLDDIAGLRVFAAVAAVVLGAAATRITHSELLQTRRDAQADRSRQAQEYAALTERRTQENAAFARDMEQRIAQREKAVGELESALAAAQRRIGETTRKMSAEARRADVAERELTEQGRTLELSEERAADAIVRVAEMEAELDTMRAELAQWKAAARKRTSA